MFAYIHPDCGKPAFLMVEVPKPFSQAQSVNARHLDGRRIQPGSAPICDSCGGMVWGFKTVNVRPMNERQLVSRNKREGWFIGRYWKGRASRARNYRLGQDDPSPYILFCHPDQLADLKRGFR